MCLGGLAIVAEAVLPASRKYGGGGGGARRVACQGQEVGSVSAARVLSCVLLLHGLMHV